jgi:hypothetical protein
MDMNQLDNLVVVARKKGRYFTGGIRAGKFVRYREIKSISDLKFKDSYITLAAYIKKKKLDISEEEVLAALNVENLYMRVVKRAKKVITKSPPVVPPGSITVNPKTPKSDTTGTMWSSYHEYCKVCIKKCKQSHLALSVYCPSRVVKRKKK